MSVRFSLWLGKLGLMERKLPWARTQHEDLNLTAEVKAKFEELVALLARGGFGDDGPPRDMLA